MNNAELIAGLRECATVGDCRKCKMHDEYSYDMCAIKLLLAAADALEAAERRIAELERQHGEQLTRNIMLTARLPKWISVKDRLPEKTKNVLAANNRGKQWDIDKAWWNGMYFDRCGKKPLFHVTHWMPLPEPPNYGADMRNVTDCHTLEDGERF